MNILISMNAHLPVITYGGTERVIWYLAHELSKMGHHVYMLVAEGSECPFAKCLYYDSRRSIEAQIPSDVDVIHFQNTNMGYSGEIPYIVTYHGNYLTDIDRNAVFVSKNHALRNNSESYVYNGLDWDDYDKFETNIKRDFFHFLGKAAWRVKNVVGAINVVNALPGEKLLVLGGNRLNLKMGFRFTWSRQIDFKGLVGGQEKINYLKHSKGLIFPVRWDEPFGLAITESLFCGCPVFGTPYGSLPELVPSEVGFLTSNKQKMIDEIRDRLGSYKNVTCHEYARDLFNSRLMAERYVEKYEKVLNGEYLNKERPVAQNSETRNRENYPFY